MGCRATRSQDELTRVVRTPAGGLEVGRTRPGRGAWLCRGSVDCVDRAMRRKAFERALKGRVTPTAVEALRAYVLERARIDGRAV